MVLIRRMKMAITFLLMVITFLSTQFLARVLRVSLPLSLSLSLSGRL
jgi:hypothetical protein